MANKQGRLLELDALRGIAAIVVVIFHFTKIRPEAKWLKVGVTGVDLFFIISGFVILMTLEKTVKWKDFAVSRFSRLYPTYWTCVTLTTLLICTHLGSFHKSFPNLAWEYVANMTMFQKYFGVRNLDAPYWTMIVEMLFYIFMLIIFIFKKLKHIELIGTIMLIPVFIYSTSFFNEHFPFLHQSISHWIPLANHFPLFLAGIIFYKIKTDKHSFRRYLLIVICFICQLFLFDDGGRSFLFISFKPYVFMLLFYFILFTLYVNGYLKSLKNNFFLFLGSISFSLYLFHQLVGTKIIIPGLMTYLHFNYWLSASIAFIIVIAVAYLISTIVEKPAMEYIRNKYKKNSMYMAGTKKSLT